MPEITHTDHPSIPASKLPSAPASAAPAVDVKKLAQVVASEATKIPELEEEIERILAKKRAERIEAAKPAAPNWATLTEQQACDPAVYIPVIEHEIPDYMNIKLKDQEYEAVWASRDQRRLGQLLAEGYEFVKPEHMATSFKMPLVFTSEGRYEYSDVIAMRVHKSILFSKRRRALDIARKQLKNNNRPPQSRVSGTFDLSEEPGFDPGMGLYEAKA